MSDIVFKYKNLKDKINVKFNDDNKLMLLANVTINRGDEDIVNFIYLYHMLTMMHFQLN